MNAATKRAADQERLSSGRERERESGRESRKRRRGERDRGGIRGIRGRFEGIAARRCGEWDRRASWWGAESLWDQDQEKGRGWSRSVISGPSVERRRTTRIREEQEMQMQNSLAEEGRQGRVNGRESRK